MDERPTAAEAADALARVEALLQRYGVDSSDIEAIATLRRSASAPTTRATGAVVHNTGVATERDVSGVGKAWGVCDCGWRGTISRGSSAGYAAAADCDAHLIRHEPDLPAGLRIDPR